jgi:opacity protein-like surface antigen
MSEAVDMDAPRRRTILAGGSRAARFVACVVVFVACASVARAQPAANDPTLEIFGGVAFGHLANCCRVFGNGPNIGGGAGLRWRRLGIQFEMNRMLGLLPKQAPCGVVGEPCVGAARDGATSTTIASANVLVFFPRKRLEPYVSGGVGALWSAQVSSVLSGHPPTFSEMPWHDRGLALNIGGGVRVPITSAIGVVPELRLYDATLLSRANLGLLRAALHISYRR